MDYRRAFIEYENDEPEFFPDIKELSIVSGGCRLYGYLLSPDKRSAGPYPTIITSHGFPGYTTNNDLELALMRMGCVVIHMNHRGAWGSEGNYLFTNLKDDLIAVAKWAHNPAIAEQYDIDTDNIFLVGHSMGGQSVLNAAKDLPFIRGVAAIAAYDIGAAFTYKMEKELFLMIETEGQCLKIQSVNEVFENALLNQHELGVINRYENLMDKNVMLVEASYDDIAPPDIMLRPLAEKIEKAGGSLVYEKIASNHSFIGQRMKLTKIIGRWIESVISLSIEGEYQEAVL